MYLITASSSQEQPIVIDHDFTAPLPTSLKIHKPLTEFFYFRDLPFELQLIIWELARPEARVIRPLKSKDDRSFYSSAKVPSMLHTSQQSRQCALKWYKLAIQQLLSRGVLKVYFDYERDYLYIDQPSLTQVSTFLADSALIKNVAIEMDISDRWRRGIVRFPLAESEFGATDFMVVSPSEKLRGDWALLTDFAIEKNPFEWQEGKSLMQIRSFQFKSHSAAAASLGWSRYVRKWTIERAWRGAYCGNNLGMMEYPEKVSCSLK